MRAKRTLRAPAAAQIAAGALILALPTAAAAAVVTNTQPATAAKRPVKVHRRHRTEIAEYSRFHVPARSRTAVAGDEVAFSGRLLPEARGRIVHLLARDGSHWKQVGWARTGRHGGFKVRYRALESGTTALRVDFRGNRRSRKAWAEAGSVTTLHDEVASWYEDAGNTACGFHAYYGVANKTLPCGTHVTISYGGRTVVATVDDRGPFVPGRDYDLNENVADALGMHAVATVLTSI